MGVVGRGLSVDGVTYFKDIVSGKKKPEWMEFGKQIAKLSGDYRILNYVTGYKGLSQFLFKVPQWPIGGIYFDGIMRTEHLSRIRPTLYPVQTGVTMTDHAIIEPAEVSIEVMMTDTTTSTYVSMDPSLDIMYSVLKQLPYSNILTCKPNPVSIAGSGRSAQAWTTLKALQQSRVPIVVETRLQTYNNMLIEELSSPDDVKTLNALRCTVRLREIIFAQVAETKTSARAAATQSPASGGQTPAQTGDNVNKTMARAGADEAKKVAESLGDD